MFYKIPFTGDINSEFSHFILAILVIAVLSLAWWTTNIRDNWQVRAVYFLDTRLRRSRSRHLQRLTNHTVSSTLVESTQPTTDSTPSQPDPITEVVTSVNDSNTTEEAKSSENSEAGECSNIENKDTPTVTTKKTENSEAGECSNIENKDGPAAIIRKMDADNNLVREKRLEFFNKRRDTLIDPNEGTSSANDNPDHGSSDIASTEEAETSGVVSTEEVAISGVDSTEKVETLDIASREEVETPDAEIIECSVKTEDQMSTSDYLQNSDAIRIKLKYLNDDLKIVEGQLSELLGEFKRRNFETEISENKLVKLIFNGQLLQRDNDSLQSYGFFNNCVVHCLIHQQRIVNEENPDPTMTNSNRSRNSRSNQRDWDLGNLFIILISVFLSSAWYFRYQYPQFFTITATMALVIITGLFAVISLGTLFPDPEIRRPETHIIH